MMMTRMMKVLYIIQGEPKEENHKVAKGKSVYECVCVCRWCKGVK